MERTHFDAIVVGSGPNGLAAAITLQREGLSVLLVEAKDTIGGGLRSSSLTLPGYTHDICSAIHPMAVTSPFFNTMPLDQHGLRFIFPEVQAAHPFEDGSAAALYQSLEQTAHELTEDAGTYQKLISPIVKKWTSIAKAVLGPLHWPNDPGAMFGFGISAIRSASALTQKFQSRKARALFAGMAAHSMQPLTNFSTAAVALLLMGAGHVAGWPMAAGGSVSIAGALGSYFRSLGGVVQTNFPVSSLGDLPSSRAILLDVTPKQLLQIAGQRLSGFYKWQLQRYRYGMGVFKMDWALSDPIPFSAAMCRKAGTIHIGNTYEEILESEDLTGKGIIPKRPFVLLAQQSLFDPTRAPEGKHTAWAYCHVPNGSTVDMTESIENQIERFAPGFKKLILSRHTMNTGELQAYNSNYIGGDIIGGMMNLGQLFTRPALRFSPYRTSAKGLYICSSSTPPGGGVHGMCGYYAARRALKDIFKRKIAVL